MGELWGILAFVACFELIDDIVDEVLRVGRLEGRVGEPWDRRPVLDCVTNRVPNHLSLRLITQIIRLTDPHSDRNLVDAGEWDFIRLVPHHIVLLELLEALLDRTLGVVQARLNRRRLRVEPLRGRFAVLG